MSDPIIHYPLAWPGETPEVVILANGKFPTHPTPLALLRNAHHVVCCDGAANEYIAQGFTPEVIIGDGDSLSAENKERYSAVMHYVPDQNSNDLTKAVNYCVSQGYTSITIVGGTGKREDHTMGNICLLPSYLKLIKHIRMVTNYGLFTPIASNATFESYVGQAVSIFNFGTTMLQGEHLQYPLRPFDGLWQGTLNKSLDERFYIFTDGKVLVYRAFEEIKR